MNNFGTSPYGATTGNNYFQQPNSYTPSTSPYNNPLTQQVNLQALMNNTTNQQIQQQQTQQDNYVSKEDYDKLLQEKRKLQEQLENEISQRIDIEFFKKEQEMMKLPEGQRIAHELEYQKNQFFEAFWRTSESGKNAMKKYRESIGLLYDQYTSNQIMPTPTQQVQPQLKVQKPMNDTPIDTSPKQKEEDNIF